MASDARVFYRSAGFFVNPQGDRLTGPVSVEIDLYPPHKARYDLDNRLKAVLDLLTKNHVWMDDSQVIELTARKHPKKGDPLIVVKVQSMRDNSNEQFE